MARTYLVLGDIDGKLDVLRVECALPTEGPLQRPQANRKIRTQRQHDEMEGAAQRRCPKRDAPQMHDRCDLICPDLPKVL
jgi:hypothetical protein